MSFLGFPNSNASYPAGLRLDGQTGNLFFRPTGASEAGPIAILYKIWKEYNDTMRMVGYSRLDYAPTVISNQNSGQLNLTSSQNQSHAVCLGTTQCQEFEITGGGDSVFVNLLLNNQHLSIDTVSWSTDTVVFKICFSPDSNDYGKQDIGALISYSRSACPFLRRNSVFHSFSAVSGPDTSKIPSWKVERNCNELTLIVLDTAGAQKPIYIKSSQANQYLKDTVKISLGNSDTGWYHYTILQQWPGCDLLFEDSIYIPSLFDIQLNAQTPSWSCYNAYSEISLNPTGGTGVQRYLWSDSSSSSTFSMLVDRDTSVWVQILDSSGCELRDSFEFTLRDTLSVHVPLIQLCTEPSTLALELVAQGQGGTLPYTFEWMGLGQGNHFNFIPPLQDTAIVLRFKDSAGCTLYDTLPIDRYIPHVPQINQDTIACNLGTLHLKILNHVNTGTYLWNGILAEDSIMYSVPSGSTSVFIRYEDSIGCLTYDTVYIVNNDNPTVDLPSDTVLCSGASLQLNADGSGAKKPYTYRWEPFTSQADSFVSNVYNSSTRVIVEIQDSNGCKSRDSIDVLTDRFIRFTENRPLKVCRNQATLNLSDISGAITGTWSGTTVYQSNGDYYFDAQLNAIGTYWLFFESSVGSGVCSIDDSLEVQIIDIPSLELPSDTGACSGLPFTLRPTNVMSANLTYTWNNAKEPGADSFSLAFVQDTLVILQIEDVNGCRNTDSTKLRVHPLPELNLLSPTLDTFCTNNAIWIDVDTIGLGPLGSVTTVPANLHKNNWRIFSDTQLFVSVMNSYGCSTDSVFKVYAKQSPQITMMDTQYTCSNTGAILLVPLASPYTGVWYSYTAFVKSGQLSTQQSDTGFNKVFYQYTGPNGCTSLDSINIYIQPAPTLDFVADSVKGKFPLTVEFTNKSNGTYQDYFTWFFGDGDSSNLENPSHVYSKTGKYTVSLKISGYLCQSRISKFNYIQVDSSDGVGMYLPDNNGIEVYPNPSHGTYRIRGLEATVISKVFDAQGKQIEIIQTRSGDILEIELKSCPPGIYLLQLEEAGRLYRIRLIKTGE